MWKWLKKFALEIAPPVTATVLGAFVVHQLWPSGNSTPQPAATPPAAHAPAESAKPASAAVGEPNATAAVPAVTPSSAVTSVAPKTGRPGRQSSEVAKTAPRDEPPVQRSETAASVLDRAEKALATIPPAKSAGPSLPARVAPPAPPPAVTMQEPVATPAGPPPAPPPPVTTAAVPVTEPPPMDPPREISAPASAGSIAAPPSSLLPPRISRLRRRTTIHCGSPIAIARIWPIFLSGMMSRRTRRLQPPPARMLRRHLRRQSKRTSLRISSRRCSRYCRSGCAIRLISGSRLVPPGLTSRKSKRGQIVLPAPNTPTNNDQRAPKPPGDRQGPDHRARDQGLRVRRDRRPPNPGFRTLGLPGMRPSRCAFLRASLRARRMASARSRAFFSEGFS